MTMSSIVTLPCGCFFEGKNFHAVRDCGEHAEKDEHFLSLRAATARWQAMYGHLSLEERRELIHKETTEGLAKLKTAGIEPMMSAGELMKLTRGDD